MPDLHGVGPRLSPRQIAPLTRENPDPLHVESSPSIVQVKEGGRPCNGPAMDTSYHAPMYTVDGILP